VNPTQTEIPGSIEAAREQEEALIKSDILAFLRQNEEKELLRFVAVGSVDDGKSTLIGRLLHDSKGVYEDQLAEATRTSDSGEQAIDFARLTDGLRAEREQGITIDVAYRYFSTPRRKFIIADTPGHVQYTRNMATGASTANVAIILIDARLGVLTQSRRHGYIGDLLGIPHLLVAVNKMDLVDWSEARFEEIKATFSAFTNQLGFHSVTFIPVSALLGVNIVKPAPARFPWYQGPTVLEFLEQVEVRKDINLTDFRMPVQTVIRPNLDYRGFAGQIVSGVIRKGDAITALPSGKTSRVKSIDTYDGELAEAGPPLGVVLRLEDEIDISRGDTIVRSDCLPHVARHLDATLVWMNEEALDAGRSYLVKHGTRYLRASVDQVRWRMDLESLQRDEQPAELRLNDIGQVRFSFHQPIVFDAYRKNRATGAFILIDSITNNTVGAGMIDDPDASTDLIDSEAGGESRSQVSRRERNRRTGQTGAILWIEGQQDEARAELVWALERRLFDTGSLAVVLEPTDARYPGHALGANLPEVAQRMADAGLLVVVGALSPAPEGLARLSVRIPDQQAASEAPNTELILENLARLGLIAAR